MGCESSTEISKPAGDDKERENVDAEATPPGSDEVDALPVPEPPPKPAPELEPDERELEHENKVTFVIYWLLQTECKTSSKSPWTT